MALHYLWHSNNQQVPLVVGDHSTHTIDQWHFNTTRRPGIHYSRTVPAADTAADAAVTSSNAQFIKQMLPQSRFIVMLRDPVDRLYSLYKMHVAESPQNFHDGVVHGIDAWHTCSRDEQQSLDDCRYLATHKNTGSVWTAKAPQDIAKSIYYYFIEEWLELFPRKQFLFIKYTDFTENPDYFINERVFPFLGLAKLEGNKHDAMVNTNVNRVIRRRPKGDGTLVDYSYNEPMLPETRRLLIDFYRPYNKLLADLLDDQGYHWGHAVG